VQAAGVFNMGDGDVRGIQLAGVFNYATSLRGVQVGVANAASEMAGLQVGVVNVGGAARGLQVGVVNVASSLAGLPLGLVNVIGDGLLLVSVGWDDKGYATLEFASGKGLYTVLAAGALLSPQAGAVAVSTMVGMGVHLPIGPFYVEAEVGARNAFGVPPTGSFVLTDLVPFPSARARAGILFFNSVGAYVGYAVDGYPGFPGEPANTLAHTGRVLSVNVGGIGISLYPRFYAGISLGRQPGAR
jgi:hypothetical protein